MFVLVVMGLLLFQDGVPLNFSLELLEFVTRYNAEDRHSGIQYMTPNQRHGGEDGELLKRRKAIYEAAKMRHPNRWSSATRNWNPVTEVWLNPPQEQRAERSEAA